MAVNLPLPIASSLRPVAGIELGFAEAGIRKQNRKDLLVMKLAPTATVAGVFTTNRFCAAPVQVCKAHLEGLNISDAPIRALVINTGNANAGTGDAGLAAANATCAALAELLDCEPSQILPFSTGVILEPLPVERLKAGLPAAIANLRTDNWYHAAEAIMTTDTQPKAASRTAEIEGRTVTLTGISKGAGMIKPNMATMLGFVATDARVSQHVLEHLVKETADRSFNCITIDGDTSTNDSFMLIATGASDVEINEIGSPAYVALEKEVISLSQQLAQMIVRDGEGATKFITIAVEEGTNVEECRRIAYAIGHSPLVKTAFFASDPNLGRILAAVGYAGVDDLDVAKLNLYLDDVWVAKNGGRNPEYREEDGQRVMKQSEITVRVKLGRGESNATIWTCDLSHDYVSINADYRSWGGFMNRIDELIARAEAVLARVEVMLPSPVSPADWNAKAFRWRKRGAEARGYLHPISHLPKIALDDLHNIERQKQAIEQNTEQFVNHKPANNVLLTGARGTGKSSLIKGCLNRFADRGLRLIEVDKDDLADLPDIIELLAGRSERFIVFCDDLSFEEGERGYKALKVALDGGITEQSDNVLIYATSNRRHLLPERMSDNSTYVHTDDGDLHPGETVEEKISLSERFGLWLSFYPFKQDDYLDIVSHWLRHFGCNDIAIEAAKADALRWALQRGSRSGRVAWQFAKDFAGRNG